MSIMNATISTNPTQSCVWPRLTELGLSTDALSRRASGIGGSDANIILSGDCERIRALWLEKRGEAEPVDLTNTLPVMLGCWTESFNRQWFERVTGNRIVNVGTAFVCDRYNWRRCTLDGLIEDPEAVWEAKHTNAFSNGDQILQRYMPQLQHNMAVAGVDRAFLSVIFGNHKFEIIEVAADWLYQLELLEAEEQFWSSVLTGKEPLAAPPSPSPKPVGTREVCLQGNNAWAAAAADWLKCRDAAKTHALACTTLKELVEPDVARAYGHGIEAKRSKSGALSLREMAE